MHFLWLDHSLDKTDIIFSPQSVIGSFLSVLQAEKLASEAPEVDLVFHKKSNFLSFAAFCGIFGSMLIKSYVFRIKFWSGGVNFSFLGVLQIEIFTSEAPKLAPFCVS